MPVELNPALVAATRYRVHQRADELRQKPSSRLLLWLASIVSIVWMIASTPLYLARIGMDFQSAGDSSIGLANGIGLWWLLPALALAAMLRRAELGRKNRKGRRFRSSTLSRNFSQRIRRIISKYFALFAGAKAAQGSFIFADADKPWSLDRSEVASCSE